MTVHLKIPATPDKPFADYKWRWATFAPTEGLNEPAVFIGVLRALYAHQGLSASSSEFQHSLELVQEETKTNVKLARVQTRNLMRN